MLTEEQIRERSQYVCGTDSSIILGVNPYESIIELWQLKLGLVEPRDLSGNPRVRAGNYLEPVVARMFSDNTGKQLLESPRMMVHPEYKWMGGNIDRMVVGEDAILEIKTASYADGWGEQGVNLIPKHYLCQVAHYMAVCQASKCYVAVLIGGWDFRVYTIERNLKLEQIIIEKERIFWEENVQGLMEPEPRNMDDVISLYRNAAIKDAAVADREVADKVSKLKMVKDKQKDLSSHEKRLKDEIALFMLDRDVLLNPNGDIMATWKYTKPPTYFDTKEFAKDNETLYNQYLKKRQSSRKFLLKGETE